ncbi:Zn-dependent exopeptidase [Westerdykella ornata]|uniref:Peptide hydrolase n=1 Tax=Westerdykella ornata TaxID=318751 RepID=A0A6A6JL97_WESOR|nr:Zn-dependent exopeptidase [Westerdykella ornata]KAF2277361.1 Zn-dependent exopeptidase [Westerdykella ornata]
MKSASILAVTALAASTSAAGGPGDGYGHGPGKGKPLVSSAQLQKLITLKDLLAGSQKLQDFANANGGNRAFGGGGHNATVDYLYNELKKTGYYNVYKQPFVELFTAATVESSANGEPFTGEYMTYGPSGNVTAPFVLVNNIGCNASDYPAAVAGNVALIKRGECTFQQKALNAKAAGAAGAVIYNNINGTLSGTLGGTGDYAPTIGVSGEIGQSLLAKVQAGETVAKIVVNAIQENRTNYNVIAETKEGDHNNVLMIGGHTDSVFAGPGINDDGSGSIGTLVVAKALTKFKVKNAVRLGFWGAEEFGKLGSNYYLKSINGTISGSPKEAAKIRAYLNFDMIASPNYVLGIYDGDGSAFNFTGPLGSNTIEKDFQDFFTSKGKPYVPSIFSGRSDYAAFLENGIPSGGLFTGAEEIKTEEEAQLFGGKAGEPLDHCYHKKCDDINNLSHEAYLLNAQSIANSVAKYAVDFKGIPKPNLAVRKRDAEIHRYQTRNGDGAHVHGTHAAPCGQGHNAI